jgi:hypothetical protein
MATQTVNLRASWVAWVWPQYCSLAMVSGHLCYAIAYTSAFSIDEELPAGPVAAIAIVSATVAIMTMAFGLHLFCCGSLSRIARGMEGKQSPANFRLI